MLFNGRALYMYKDCAARRSDIDILHHRAVDHETFLQKKLGEKSVLNGGLQNMKYRNSWAIPCNKEYQGV